MKRSSRPRKITRLSQSMHQQLNMYALAAGAAGVSVLALSPSSEAKIVYTATDKNIMPDHTISLDVTTTERSISVSRIRTSRVPRMGSITPGFCRSCLLIRPTKYWDTPED